MLQAHHTHHNSINTDEEGRVQYPIIQLNPQSSNFWSVFSQELTGRNFGHFLRSNKKDDLYIKILKNGGSMSRPMKSHQSTHLDPSTRKPIVLFEDEDSRDSRPINTNN